MAHKSFISSTFGQKIGCVGTSHNSGNEENQILGKVNYIGKK